MAPSSHMKCRPSARVHTSDEWFDAPLDGWVSCYKLLPCNRTALLLILGFTADSEQTVMTFLWSEWRWWAGCDVCYFGTGYLSERRSNSTATRHCKRCCTWAKSAESWCRSRCSPSRSRTYAAAPWIAPIIASIPFGAGMYFVLHIHVPVTAYRHIATSAMANSGSKHSGSVKSGVVRFFVMDL
ncbi:hypothetical protein FIBSPDRAFT_464176 [Athelia psychrophila]|uniref:Uncharacterized protein n=1 Tax=Athelia psychrophila TaxID=1759441 RepID=A0A166LQF1_9AGAM|nr:hypothetical protein FIBSPDRAFT_464176 [Fibularhizoctonia sp. CBS 109695]